MKLGHEKQCTICGELHRNNHKLCEDCEDAICRTCGMLTPDCECHY